MSQTMFPLSCFHPYSSIVYRVMGFLFKQPSVQPCILCASHCPPHDVLHEIDDFPLYYNPLYYPLYNTSVFKTKVSVCLWILEELKIHLISCQSCAPLPGVLKDFEDGVSFFYPYFRVAFAGTCLLVPFEYVESPFFSFCYFTWTYAHIDVKIVCFFIQM